MICDCLDKYNQGKMEDTEFNKHAASCPTCQEALKLDEEVMSMAESLKQHIEAPGLWNRIEEAIQKEHKRFSLRWRLLRFVPAACALIIVLGLGIYIGFKIQTPSSGLLAQKALARVEQEEQEYLKAIQELEKQVLPKMASLDLKLVFLYRNRLETIDAQIEQCREALASNPANAHIRRYLMMALHDKKETLAEVLNPENQKEISRRSI
jgi:hypothetical protein